MKKLLTLISTLAYLLIGIFAFAQAPQKFNYQGIARDAKGNPMSKQTLALKLSVLPTSDATVPEYEETQLVTTNEFGLYTLQIGNGTAITGEMKTVKWETGNKYIKVAIDPTGGTNYVDAGTNQLLSVPYALYADKAGEAREGAGSTIKATRATNNYIEKTNGAGVANSTSLLYDNGSNIGMGTTAPAAKFHMNGTGTNELRIQSAGGSPRLSFFGDAATGFTSTANYALMYKRPATDVGNFSTGFANAKLFIFGNAQGSLLFNTGGNVGFGYFNQAANTTTTNLFVEGTTGNIGIGTATPFTKLHVASVNDTTAYFTSSSTNETNGIVRANYIGSTIADHIAIAGRSVPNAAQNYGIGLYGEGGFIGVQSLAKVADTFSVYGSLNEGNSRGETYGIYGIARPDIAGNFGSKIGVYGKAEFGASNVGVYGDVDATGGTTNYAGFFNGNVGVNGDLIVGGNLSKAGGTFKIDHPQDPENKYLIHSFVESPDMMNVYNGNAITNVNGKAIISLPTYFESENKDFRYQVTVIGQRADVWISEEINSNQFEIETDKPNVKISWQVTGVRKDVWADANRVVAEVEKTPEDKGFYLHPILFGKSSTKQIGYNKILKPKEVRKK